MTISIHSAPASVLSAQRATRKHTQEKNNTLSELSSGKKNSSSLSQEASLESQLRGLEATSLVIDHQSLSLSRESASAVSRLENLQSLREVALQASDATIGGSERAALAERASALGVTVEGVDLSSPTASQDSIAVIDSALQSQVSDIAENGSQQNILEMQRQTNQVMAIEYAKAASSSSDTDIAEAASHLVSQSILQKASVLVQGAAMKSMRGNLKLLV